MSLKLGRIIEKYGASGDRDTAEVEFVLADLIVTDGKTMKRRVRVLAKVLGGTAAVVFVCPPSLFARDFAPGILVQSAIYGALILIALICWQVGDASDQENE
jgi:hypothetical protein